MVCVGAGFDCTSSGSSFAHRPFAPGQDHRHLLPAESHPLGRGREQGGSMDAQLGGNNRHWADSWPQQCFWPEDEQKHGNFKNSMQSCGAKQLNHPNKKGRKTHVYQCVKVVGSHPSTFREQKCQLHGILTHHQP